MNQEPAPQPAPPVPPVAPAPQSTPESAPQPQPQPQPPMAPQPSPGYASGAPVATENPGKTLGIVSIVLSVLLLWIVGLPLGIVSIVKSNKAKASPLLGIIGTVLNVLAIGGSIVVFAIVASILMTATKGIQDKAAQRSASNSTAESSAVADTPLSDAYHVTNGDGNAYWSVPASHTGWKVTTFDQEGRNVLDADDGHARFVSFQGLDNYSGSDRAMTLEGIAEYLGGVQGVAGTKGTMNFAQMSNGKSVEFATQEYTFSDTKGNVGKGIVAARVFDGGRILLVNYSASTSGYSPLEWRELTGKMQINDGVL